MTDSDHAEGAGRLVAMANQIGKFFAAQRDGSASSAIADHLRKFWDPRMRVALIAHFEGGGAGLDPPVLEAIKYLKNR